MLRYICLSILPEFLRNTPPKILQTCSNGTFSPVSGSSAFLPNISLYREARVYLSWAALSFTTQSLWFTPLLALTNIWPQILLMHLEFKVGLAGNNPTTSSLSAAMCAENPDHHPLLQCPRHTLAELSQYRVQARQRGSVGVLGTLRRKYEGSCCLFCCVIGAASFIIQTHIHCCHLTLRMRRHMLGEGKSNYDILYNWTLGSKLGFMHALTFPGLLIFTSRSSHSHSAPANQQYTDDVTQRLIMQLAVSHRRLTQSPDNMTDLTCLFLSSVLISAVSVW